MAYTPLARGSGTLADHSLASSEFQPSLLLRAINIVALKSVF